MPNEMSIVEGVVDGVANVRTYGARGDDLVDDSEAIQKAIDESPGPVYFPPGKYRVHRTLEVKKPGMSFFGFSDPRGKGRATAIRYTAREGVLLQVTAGGLSVEGLFIYGVTRSDPTTAIQIETGDAFSSGYDLERVGVIQFGRGLVINRDETAKNPSVGKVCVHRSNLSGNGQGIVCVGDSRISNLDILSSEVRQNLGAEPVIDVCVRRGSIVGCCLEGQPRVIRVRNSYAVTVTQGYFEGNSKYLLSAEHSKGVWFYDNYQRLLKSEEYVEPFVLKECSDIRCERPITNNGKWELP